MKNKHRKKPRALEFKANCWSDSMAAQLACIVLPALKNGSAVTLTIRAASPSRPARFPWQ
ncbi:MAG: hypothetical protein KGR98_03615 [Verrucomicrobia bacterium]|nr:hypothetical protein [Verrucomicrobiota bacterium]